MEKTWRQKKNAENRKTSWHDPALSWKALHAANQALTPVFFTYISNLGK
jgi:hypothetical protein